MLWYGVDTLNDLLYFTGQFGDCTISKLKTNVRETAAKMLFSLYQGRWNIFPSLVGGRLTSDFNGGGLKRLFS